MSNGKETSHFQVCLDIEVCPPSSCTKPIGGCLSHVTAQGTDFFTPVSPKIVLVRAPRNLPTPGCKFKLLTIVLLKIEFWCDTLSCTAGMFILNVHVPICCNHSMYKMCATPYGLTLPLAFWLHCWKYILVNVLCQCDFPGLSCSLGCVWWIMTYAP